MALSQKHVGKCVVPWFCRAEWTLVFEKIYGENHNENTRSEALFILNIWKSRTPLLPRGVEGTYIILEALLFNRTNRDDYNTQMLLSTSIMRFLNICAVYDKNQGTFYQTACKIRLPEWLINLRHEIAHGQSLPTLYVLDKAMEFCLEWLYNEYWKPYSSEMKDFIDDTEFEDDKYEELKSTIQPLITNYCYVALATHPFWNVAQVKDIVDEEEKAAILEELETLTSTLDINENISFIMVQKLLWHNIEKVLNNYEDVQNKEHILPELLIKESIFLGEFDERKEIFESLDEIPLSFLMLWNRLLIAMQRLNMIEPLIEKLLRLLTIDEIKHESKIIASLWLLEIGKGLLKCVFAHDLTKKLNRKGVPPPQIKSKVQEIIKEQFTGRHVINFNHNLNIPDITKNCSKLKNLLLEKPNKYTQIFISEYLDLNEILKCREHKTQILELVNIYTSSENEVDEIPNEIHNVEELMEISAEQKETTKTNEVIQQHPNKINTEEFFSDKRWRKVTEFNFEKCPIGILPWQEASMNPLLH